MADLYQQSVPVMLRYLGNASSMLEKAAAHADEKGIKHEDFLAHKLTDELLPITRYIGGMCNVVKWLAVRVFQVTDAPVFDDEEKKSFAELQTRIQAMVDLLKSIDPTKAVARENSMSMRFKNGMEFTTESAQAYVSGYALPLFFWQLSSAYGLMRKQGVPITVGDYIKGVLQPVAA